MAESPTKVHLYARSVSVWGFFICFCFLGGFFGGRGSVCVCGGGGGVKLIYNCVVRISFQSSQYMHLTYVAYYLDMLLVFPSSIFE